tara:strand:+ start:1804 stop:2187 length:384 start_codon:yes stop_codon:yes gene_type:complete
MQYQEPTNQIIELAYKVYNTLGYGFLESVYEKSLLIEFKKNEITVENQESIKVYYENEIVGDFIADLYVENKIIVELKSVKAISLQHEVQLVNYLTSTNNDVGLLINFSENKVQVKRKVRILTPPSR